MTGSSFLTTGAGGGGVGRMLGVGGGSSATSPSRSVQRVWMASNYVRRCVLDASNGGGYSCYGVNDSVSTSYFWDWDGMMLETECVGDPLAARVGHEDSNATIVNCGMQYVPCLGCKCAMES